MASYELLKGLEFGRVLFRSILPDFCAKQRRQSSLFRAEVWQDQARPSWESSRRSEERRVGKECRIERSGDRHRKIHEEQQARIRDHYNLIPLEWQVHQ